MNIMGSGFYSASDWAKLKQSRGLSNSAGASQTFTNRTIKESLNSRFIACRESFDSADSPRSTPLIIGFDVTGSMGYLADEIAKKSLNDTIMKILEEKTIEYPHIMCAAFTNTTLPLQATQFEADIRVVEQLLDFTIGGGNPYASDNLLWYFAAKHTKIDSFNKRGKKGILIGIGDEKCDSKANILNPECIKAAFDEDVNKTYSFNETAQMASEKYELYHIVIGENYRFDTNNFRESYTGWCEALPGRVARIKAANVEYLDWLIISIIRLSQGEDKAQIINSITDAKIREIIAWGMADMTMTPSNKFSLIGSKTKTMENTNTAVSSQKTVVTKMPRQATKVDNRIIKPESSGTSVASNGAIAQDKKPGFFGRLFGKR